ncbi:hypothetical protein ABD68_06390 [Bacillus endophyticus]|uniref:hypothetical protein n=1 Tax=Priestia endophytica TaxID=135735 RepID=UPI0018CDFBF6|nr:hypothetical protein [Priestia endophytica]MBG9811241.1 hypothetical protein [Priestia endophytica]
MNKWLLVNVTQKEKYDITPNGPNSFITERKIKMIYGIGHRDGNTLSIDKHITKEEYDKHLKELSKINTLTAMKNVFSLFKRNGEEFINYSSKMKRLLGETSYKDEDDVLLEANRLLINYLSSLSMFIDYGERYNKKHFGKQKMKEFESTTHDFYDNHVSYRFMALMRNYALHYGFPLTEVIRSLENVSGIFASRDNLLQFKAWKHVKEDLEKMSPLIQIDIHVEVSMMFIKHLYENYVYDISSDIFSAIEYMAKIMHDNGGKQPIFAIFKDREEFKKGNIKLKLIEPETYQEALKILRDHPSININAV